MRKDLTPSFLSKATADSRKPIQLAIFRFQEFGNVYVSDRNITVGGILYKGLVEDWGNLSTVGNEDSVSGTMQMSITLWNSGNPPFASYFNFESPINVFVDVYQYFDGLPNLDKAVIGHFVIQDPLSFSEVSSLITIDLVTTNMRYFGQVGRILSRSEFPFALERDLNKTIDLIIGDCGEINALCTVAPLRCTMSGSILKKAATYVYTHEDLNTLLFPASGYIQIDAEILRYTSKTANSFYISARGQLSTLVSEHSDGATIIQANKNIEYIVGQGPITSITQVKVKGQTPTVPYTVYPNLNPAKIVFTKQPTFAEFSKGARIADIDFDATASGNGAYQPHYSYDPLLKSYGAIVSKTYTPLAILQTDPAPDDGEIVKVFLSIEHWADKLYANDYVSVYVAGIGTVGTLSRPNPSDITDVSGNVDIDHVHAHESGGTHDHPFANPSIATADPVHTHPASLVGATIVDGGYTGLPIEVGSYSSLDYHRIDYATQSNIASQKVHIRFQQRGTGIVSISTGPNHTGKIIEWNNLDKDVDQWVNLSSYRSYLYIVVSSIGVIGGKVILQEMSLHTTLKANLDASKTNVVASLPTLGKVNLKGSDTTGTAIKAADDVDPLATANRVLENIATTSSSRTVIDKFDLTDFLAIIDWNWLNDRRVELRYIGTLNNAKIIVTYITFEVEYRQRIIRTTDDISAYVIGSIPNRPDQVIQYLLTEKAGVPESKFDSVWRHDNPTNTNETDLFQQAASKYIEIPYYTIDGSLAGNLSVKEAVKKVTWQSRSKLLWQGGKVKLLFNYKKNGYDKIRDLELSDIQLKSFSAKLGLTDNIVNDIDVYYDLNRTLNYNEPSAYKASYGLDDSYSIQKHGQRKKDDLFLFDLVKNPSMAQNLADYYLWYLGEPITYYYVNTYLKNFDLEKGDCVTLSSYKFSSLKKLPVLINEMIRSYGSGKLGNINLFTLICESVRNIILRAVINDSVSVQDSLRVVFGTNFEFEELVLISDLLDVVEGKDFEEAFYLDDILELTMSYNVGESETINVSDEISFKHSFNLASSFTVSDSLQAILRLPDVFEEQKEDTFNLESVLTIIMNVGLENDVVLEDEINFSTGFGSPGTNGAGFGKTPFGH